MGHLAEMCGHLCLLRVYQLLQWENQVVYPEGLSGGLELVVTSLSESLAHNLSMLNESAQEPVFLLVDFSKVTPGDHVPEASAPHRTSAPTSPTHLTMGCPPKAESPHQHDCWGLKASITCCAGHLQPGTGGFHPKEANILDPGGSILCQSRRLLSQ